MKAAVVTALGGPDVFAYQDVPVPEPGPDQILLRVHATSVNYADIKARAEGYKGQKPPFIPGLDAAGVIEKVGERVQGLREGQRVVAYTTGGAYCEFALAEAVTCYPLPDNVSFEQGAGIGTSITAYNVLTLAGNLQQGEVVLVHAGAGGVGSVAVQLARELGASKVIATVGSPEKRDFARSCGADEVINYNETDFTSRVLEITGGVGADLILESIAGENAERSMGCLAEFGRVVIFGHTGTKAATFQSTQLHAQNRGVIGYSSGGYRKHRPERLRKSAQAALALMSSETLTVHAGGAFQIAEAAKAHTLVESRKSVGKILLYPGP